jgi:hypothetical protein
MIRMLRRASSPFKTYSCIKQRVSAAARDESCVTQARSYSHLGSSQVGLETTIEQFPEPWPIEDMVTPVHPAQPPEMPHEVDGISRRSTLGCLSSSQAGLEAAVRQPPEPQLIDNVVALIRARLAA